MKRSCENNFDSFIPVDPLAPKKMRNKKIQENYGAGQLVTATFAQWQNLAGNVSHHIIVYLK